jgi:hypothetical protein
MSIQLHRSPNLLDFLEKVVEFFNTPTNKVLAAALNAYGIIQFDADKEGKLTLLHKIDDLFHLLSGEELEVYALRLTDPIWKSWWIYHAVIRYLAENDVVKAERLAPPHSKHRAEQMAQSEILKHYGKQGDVDSFLRYLKTVDKRMNKVHIDWAKAMLIEAVSSNQSLESAFELMKTFKFEGYNPALEGRVGVDTTHKIIELADQYLAGNPIGYESLFAKLYAHLIQQQKIEEIKIIIDRLISYSAEVDPKIKGAGNSMKNELLWKAGTWAINIGDKEKLDSIIKQLKQSKLAADLKRLMQIK